MPYVVSNPYSVTAVQPAKFVVTLDGGTPTEIDPQTLADGTKRLRYDVSSVLNGQHSVTVKARNEWGDSAAVPFTFTRAVPAVPAGIALEL